MQRPMPKAVRTYFGGEAAKGRAFKPRTVLDEGRSFNPRKRKSDGPPSKVLHVYRLRLSTTEAEMRSLFEPFGEVTRVILYKPQFAYVAQKATSDGAYIDVVLRAVQFMPGNALKMGNRPFDKLRIDFINPTLPLPQPMTMAKQESDQ